MIDAVTEVVRGHNWQILDEQYGLARDGQRLFGFMRINKTHSPEWSRCIGIRNSHDQSIAVGLAAGLCVKVCSNLMLGGSMVLKRRHTSRIELNGLVMEAIDELDNEFLTLETVAEDLKMLYVKEIKRAPPSSRARKPELSIRPILCQSGRSSSNPTTKSLPSRHTGAC